MTNGVWLVRQTQPSEDYYQRTIAVYDKKEDAERIARRLNKTYGNKCIFDEDWDFVEIDWNHTDEYGYHYYDIEWQDLNPKASDFLWEM